MLLRIRFVYFINTANDRFSLLNTFELVLPSMWRQATIYKNINSFSLQEKQHQQYGILLMLHEYSMPYYLIIKRFINRRKSIIDHQHVDQLSISNVQTKLIL